MRFTLYTALTIAVLTLFSSCGSKPEPRFSSNYSLYTVKYVPDSLKLEYRTWITETVRAASYNMTGGDYERPDWTIMEAKEKADDIFQKETIGLRLEIKHKDEYPIYHYILPSEMNEKEKDILNSLLSELY